MKPIFTIILLCLLVIPADAAWWFHWPWKPTPVKPPVTHPVTNAPPVVTNFPPTGTATLTWTASTAPSVTGYKIYVGKSSGNYTTVTTIGNLTTISIGNLDNHTQYFFAVTAIDGAGHESVFSNEASEITK